MYEVQKDSHESLNFIAGDFPILRDTAKIKTGAVIRERAPVILGATGVEEATADKIADIIGIAAAVPSGDRVVIYLTGEFFGSEIILPDGITVDALKPILRKLSIFLR